MYNYELHKLTATLASQLLATQLAQIQLWKGDDVCIDRLETTCVEIAKSIIEKSND